MKRLNILIVAFLFYQFSNGQSAKEIADLHCLSQTDAEKILGQSAKLLESNVEKKDSATYYRCTYTLLIQPSATCNLYYQFEKYADTLLAKNVYKQMIANNREMQGQKPLSDLGEEAFLHTDQQHFDLIIFRKGNKLVRIKVNKITNTTSLKGMEQVARRLASLI
ncbi:hypothetical protein [Pinibacter aurantiacus]|uniref:Uncharacterized protein n=1 Tax=Pinibacter aurantiacus TaxID=2851599 RepID=A0A9E2W8U2_9BACT|nr:hypothetical protein [Pinibacter aurantiacus]MBV4359026.1 hypothetical protein [Pinibacter aurantiacus]